MIEIEIDDWNDDDVEESTETSAEDNVRMIIQQGLNDLEDIVVLLEKLENLVLPFGGISQKDIDELKLFYKEICPDVLLGKYKDILADIEEDSDEIAQLSLKRTRKEMFDKLTDKYNE